MKTHLEKLFMGELVSKILYERASHIQYSISSLPIGKDTHLYRDSHLYTDAKAFLDTCR